MARLDSGDAGKKKRLTGGVHMSVRGKRKCFSKRHIQE
jgi:hypothetical protein